MNVVAGRAANSKSHSLATFLWRVYAVTVTLSQSRILICLST
jgi:hypothetical protein